MIERLLCYSRVLPVLGRSADVGQIEDYRGSGSTVERLAERFNSDVVATSSSASCASISVVGQYALIVR
jgi:hypothetical protein